MCHYKSPLSLLAAAGRFKYYVQRTEWRNRNSSVWSLKTEHYAKQQCSAIIILARSHLAIFPGIIAELCVSARRPAAALAIFATKMCQIWERCVRECFVNMTISDQSPATVLLFLLPICCHREGGLLCMMHPKTGDFNQNKMSQFRRWSTGHNCINFLAGIIRI